MTICVLLFKNSFPVVITDNLISNKQGVRNLSTPLTKNENRKGVDGYKPAGIANKVWKISINDRQDDTCYIMYSGNVKHAKELSDYIKSKLSYQSINEIELNDIKNYASTQNLEVSIILVYMDNEGYFSHYVINANEHCSYTPSILSIGSGYEELESTLQKIVKQHHKFIANIAHSEIHEKIAFSLLLIAYLTSDYLYLGDYSSFAQKSCGALYHNYTFPTLYYDNKEDIPPYIKNGNCQLFIDFCYVQNKFFIKRLVHTRQCVYSNNIISTVIELNAPIPIDNEINILKYHSTIYTIKNYKDESQAKSEFRPFSSSQMILYASVGVEHTRTIHYYPNIDIISCNLENSILNIKFNYSNEQNFFSRITDRILNSYSTLAFRQEAQ